MDCQAGLLPISVSLEIRDTLRLPITLGSTRSSGIVSVARPGMELISKTMTVVSRSRRGTGRVRTIQIGLVLPDHTRGIKIPI